VDNVLMFVARRSVKVAAALAFCAIAAPACSKVQARTPAAAPAEPPPLTTPEPPSRLKLPVSVDPPPSTGSTTEKPATPANSGKPPAPPAAGSSTPPATTTPPERPASPVIQAGAAVEQRARDRLLRAKNDLGRVQRASLSVDAREQYDSAQRFVKMAEDKLREKNFVYAEYCADKAATLASLLVKAGGRVPIV
jgi:hypothetical protein